METLLISGSFRTPSVKLLQEPSLFQAVKGVVAYISATDIPGVNTFIGVAEYNIQDEEVSTPLDSQSFKRRRSILLYHYTKDKQGIPSFTTSSTR